MHRSSCPWSIPGATVDAGQIAQSLVVLMLVPLGIGLVVRARYPGLADDWVGPVGQASSAGLLIGISAAILLTWQDIIGAIGTWIFVGTAIVLVTGLLAGWLVGWGRPRDRVVLGLATAQRNIAAALVVASSIGGDTLLYTLVGALVIPIVLIVLAGEVGRRIAARQPAPADA